MCGRAAEGGYLEVLRWAREHYCPWGEGTRGRDGGLQGERGERVGITLKKTLGVPGRYTNFHVYDFVVALIATGIERLVVLLLQDNVFVSHERKRQNTHFHHSSSFPLPPPPSPPLPPPPPVLSHRKKRLAQMNRHSSQSTHDTSLARLPSSFAPPQV